MNNALMFSKGGKESRMSEPESRVMVMVSRERAAHWWHRPWDEVVSAAERGEDGLCVRTPTFTPLWPTPPRRENYLDKNGNPDDARYEAMAAAYTTEQQQAFLREGDGYFARGKTMLFQQNW